MMTKTHISLFTPSPAFTPFPNLPPGGKGPVNSASINLTCQISPLTAGVFNGGIISPVGEIRKGVSEMFQEETGQQNLRSAYL